MTIRCKPSFVCEVCGKGFNDKRSKNRKFCSRQCLKDRDPPKLPPPRAEAYEPTEAEIREAGKQIRINKGEWWE